MKAALLAVFAATWLSTLSIAVPFQTSSGSKIPVVQTLCNGKKYIYNELAGYGYLSGDARDVFGDTISMGSSSAIDQSSWKKKGDTWTGLLWALPDRGWNTEGNHNIRRK
jgi:hypothetical protein